MRTCIDQSLSICLDVRLFGDVSLEVEDGLVCGNGYLDLEFARTCTRVSGNEEDEEDKVPLTLI